MQGWGLSDGPRSEPSIQAIKSWKTNVVRIGLNEHCWLAINGAPSAFSGAVYQQAVKDYVSLLNRNGMYAILTLMYSAPGETLATDWWQPMPNADHSPTFWSEVAAAFKDNNAVILEPYNEPHPDFGRDGPAAWTCWRDGGTCPGVAFEAAGMQRLIDVIRATGATNVISLSGVAYSNALGLWLDYRPTDPLNNLVAAWHVYGYNVCNTVPCFEATVAPIATAVPLLAAEIGDRTCEDTFMETVMGWLDARQAGYLAFSWNAWSTSCQGWSLILNYDGTPTVKGEVFRAHLARL